MKLDSVRVRYAQPNTAPIGYFEAGLSPDGWRDSRYVNETDKHLFASEITEFSSLVRSFMHELSTPNDLKKYFAKHGADTDAVTQSIRFDCALMTYLVHANGCAVTFLPYRKENA